MLAEDYDWGKVVKVDRFCFCFKGVAEVKKIDMYYTLLLLLWTINDLIVSNIMWDRLKTYYFCVFLFYFVDINLCMYNDGVTIAPNVSEN